LEFKVDKTTDYRHQLQLIIVLLLVVYYSFSLFLNYFIRLLIRFYTSFYC